MARIFDAVTGKICRKDVWKKMRNRLFKQAVSLLYDISTKDFVKPAERTKIFFGSKNGFAQVTVRSRLRVIQIVYCSETA